MSLSADKLRHVISFEEEVEVVDSAGYRSKTWQKVFNRVYASVDQLSGKEMMSSSVEYSKVSARITIRYRENINHSMRIIHRDNIYNIEAVINDNKSGVEWMTLLVSTGVRK